MLFGDEGVDGLLSVVLQAPPRLCKAFCRPLMAQHDSQHEVVEGGAVGLPIANRHRTSILSKKRIPDMD